MSRLPHTEGKLRRPTMTEIPFQNAIICDDSGASLGEMTRGYPTLGGSEQQDAANADRVVACWNAMDGIRDPEGFVTELLGMVTIAHNKLNAADKTCVLAGMIREMVVRHAIKPSQMETAKAHVFHRLGVPGS